MGKKTAMEKLIKMIETFMVVNDDIPDYHDGLEKALELAKSLLPKERGQIEEAYREAEMVVGKMYSQDYYSTAASDYFTQTYGK